jgi:lipopolysaccharide biosynthesis glycosyltransferase
MEPVVIALASDERYFPGLYCAVASLLSYLDSTRRVDLKVLDGGVSSASIAKLSALVDRFNGTARLEFVTVDWSVFRDATLGPGQSRIAYCRMLLPQLLDVQRVIYLDCDVLVFRDLSELFDGELSSGKVIAAVHDSETLTLADDSANLANAMCLPRDGAYFNSGLMLLDLTQLRKSRFTKQSVDFLAKQKGHYRFHDQSAINFLLHGKIVALPEHWNRASWRFDQQDDNHLNCVLHYTRSAPWLCGTPGPAQVLFERLATEVGLAVDRLSPDFRRAARQRFWRNILAPLRVVAFATLYVLHRIAGRKETSAAYQKVALYWLGYLGKLPNSRRLYRRRTEEIRTMKLALHGSPVAP